MLIYPEIPKFDKGFSLFKEHLWLGYNAYIFYDDLMSTCEAKKELVPNPSDFSETKVHETTSQNNCYELINPNRGMNEEKNIESYNYCQSKIGHIYCQAKWTIFTVRLNGHVSYQVG